MARPGANKTKRAAKRSRHTIDRYEGTPEIGFDSDEDSRTEDHTAELSRLRSQVLALKNRNAKLAESTQRLNMNAQKAESQLRKEVGETLRLQATLDATKAELKEERKASQSARRMMNIRSLGASDSVNVIIGRLQDMIHEERSRRLAAEAERDKEKQLAAHMSLLNEVLRKQTFDALESDELARRRAGVQLVGELESKFKQLGVTGDSQGDERGPHEAALYDLQVKAVAALAREHDQDREIQRLQRDLAVALEGYDRLKEQHAQGHKP
ncbi:hypothetical protein FRB94_012812 [Tulasnella sp. JGI-2019a]|nr:hypothetical protein FRB94_012812 [Tulasnella sp. JGI-2019a]KAG9031524.1 hypothetical protein FRB95_002659 [Tulasnella sp. JGI-2019a]